MSLADDWNQTHVLKFFLQMKEMAESSGLQQHATVTDDESDEPHHSKAKKLKKDSSTSASKGGGRLKTVSERAMASLNECHPGVFVSQSNSEHWQ